MAIVALVDRLTVDCVNVAITTDFFHEQQRLCGRVGVFNRTECLSRSKRGQAQVVLASCIQRVAFDFVVEG